MLTLPGCEEITVEPAHIDLGPVISMQRFPFRFTVRNRFDRAVKFLGAFPACGCTVVDDCPEQIDAEGTVVVSGEIQIDPGLGKISKSLNVQVDYGQGKQNAVVWIYADVQPSPHLAASLRKIDFGRASSAAGTVERSIRIYRLNAAALGPLTLSSTHEAIRCSIDSSRQSGTNIDELTDVVIDIAVDVSGLPAGPLDEDIKVEASDGKRMSIPVRGLVLDKDDSYVERVFVRALADGDAVPVAVSGDGTEAFSVRVETQQQELFKVVTSEEPGTLVFEAAGVVEKPTVVTGKLLIDQIDNETSVSIPLTILRTPAGNGS